MALCVRTVWRSLEKEFRTRLSTRKPDRSSTIIFNREKDTTVPGNFLRKVRRKFFEVSPNFFALFRSCRRLPLPDRARGRRTRSFPARFVNFSHQGFTVLIIGFYFRRPLTNRVAEKIWSLNPVALYLPAFLDFFVSRTPRIIQCWSLCVSNNAPLDSYCRYTPRTSTLVRSFVSEKSIGQPLENPRRRLWRACAIHHSGSSSSTVFKLKVKLRSHWCWRTVPSTFVRILLDNTFVKYNLAKRVRCTPKHLQTQSTTYVQYARTNCLPNRLYVVRCRIASFRFSSHWLKNRYGPTLF